MKGDYITSIDLFICPNSAGTFLNDPCSIYPLSTGAEKSISVLMLSCSCGHILLSSVSKWIIKPQVFIWAILFLEWLLNLFVQHCLTCWLKGEKREFAFGYLFSKRINRYSIPISVVLYSYIFGSKNSEILLLQHSVSHVQWVWPIFMFLGLYDFFKSLQGYTERWIFGSKQTRPWISVP